LQCTLTLLKEATLTFHEPVKLTAQVMDQYALRKLLQRTSGAKRAAFGDDFSDAEIEKILSCMFISKLPKGAPILVYGQEARFTGYVVAGVAEARAGFSDEVEKWMNEGEWIGSRSFTSNYMARTTYYQSYYSSAVSSVLLAAISMSQYRTLCKKHPSVGFRLLHRLASKNMDLYRASLTTMGVCVDTREAYGFPSAVVGDGGDGTESFWSEHPRTAPPAKENNKLTRVSILDPQDSIIFSPSAADSISVEIPNLPEAHDLLSPLTATVDGAIFEFGRGGSRRARSVSRQLSRGPLSLDREQWKTKKGSIFARSDSSFGQSDNPLDGLLSPGATTSVPASCPVQRHASPIRESDVSTDEEEVDAPPTPCITLMQAPNSFSRSFASTSRRPTVSRFGSSSQIDEEPVPTASEPPSAEAGQPTPPTPPPVRQPPHASRDIGEAPLEPPSPSTRRGEAKPLNRVMYPSHPIQRKPLQEPASSGWEELAEEAPASAPRDAAVEATKPRQVREASEWCCAVQRQVPSASLGAWLCLLAAGRAHSRVPCGGVYCSGESRRRPHGRSERRGKRPL
jgi:CRP-like cAMP-binding protein